MPGDVSEHVEMVNRLIKAGSLQTEAETIISTRIKAYNKACCDVRKLNNSEATQTKKKVDGKSKLVKSPYNKNGL
jgi:hypothetical protein